MRRAVRSLWAEPRPPQPPTRVWPDRLLVIILWGAAAVEMALRDDLGRPPVGLLVGAALIAVLPMRRRHPLAVVAVVFGSLAAVDLLMIVAAVEPAVPPYTTAYLMLLPYSLLRWGSGREAALGLVIVAGFNVVREVAAPVGTGGAVAGALLFFLMPAAVGASVRYRASSRLREIERVRLLEREQLARELHDTVAHHMSAIAIQAQAGRTLAADHPGRALSALGIIEEEASRTLAEMRSMVGLLRTGEEPDLAPRRGLADLPRLARSRGQRPHVAVELSGDLDSLSATVDAALYRLAQESVTNAVRHARNASRIDVHVVGEDRCVRVTVVDDGDAVASRRGPSGFGLTGMAERAALLDGTFEAGPAEGRGWRVSAVIPRSGAAT